VLRGVEGNLTNKEIGARLNLSERTVKFHVSALLDKFEVRNRASLLLHMANLPSAGMASGKEAPLQLPSRKNGHAAQDLQNEPRKTTSARSAGKKIGRLGISNRTRP